MEKPFNLGDSGVEWNDVFSGLEALRVIRLALLAYYRFWAWSTICHQRTSLLDLCHISNASRSCGLKII
jgi:hypothetical protein